MDGLIGLWMGTVGEWGGGREAISSRLDIFTLHGDGLLFLLYVFFGLHFLFIEAHFKINQLIIISILQIVSYYCDEMTAIKVFEDR